MKNSQRAKSSDWLTTSLYHATLNTAIVAVLLALLGLIDPSVATAKKNARPTRSTTIALTSDERNLVVVNREANSLSIIKVKNANGNDVSNKLAEIPVGEEPRCVAVSLDDRFAFVTNAISATVSVVDLVQDRVVKTIKVGTEPRVCAVQAIPRVAAQPGWASLKEKEKTSASQG